jgi:hypothetical protein
LAVRFLFLTLLRLAVQRERIRERERESEREREREREREIIKDCIGLKGCSTTALHKLGAWIAPEGPWQWHLSDESWRVGSTGLAPGPLHLSA